MRGDAIKQPARLAGSRSRPGTRAAIVAPGDSAPGERAGTDIQAPTVPVSADRSTSGTEQAASLVALAGDALDPGSLAGSATQQPNGFNPGQRPQNGLARGFRAPPPLQGRSTPLARPQQPPVPRAPQTPAAPFNGDSAGEGLDGRQSRRRRRRRGRNGLAPVQGAAPAGIQQGPARPPSYQAPVVEERPVQEFRPQQMAVVEYNGMLDFLHNGTEAFVREFDLRVRPAEDPLIGIRDIRRFDLRNGDIVRLEARPGRGRGPVQVERLISLNDQPYDEALKRPRFEDLTAVYPDRMITLETGQYPLTTRLLDLMAPVGFGQRALIVSPPKAGKTTLLKNIGQGVIANYPSASLIVCLVGERPEEVTDLRGSLPQATMFASSFDEEVERHGHLAEMALERAKRLAEQGRDVVVLLDSITRLARAYNLGPGSGGNSRTLSGGMDASALTTARRIFGAARAIEQGGSLTIIATCLVDTGSRLDDVVYEEFKGTGNMELHLDRGLAERRIFPAIDISRSSTRKEELLLDPDTLRFVTLLRRRLAGVQNSAQAMAAAEQLIDRLAKTESNKAFFESFTRAPSS